MVRCGYCGRENPDGARRCRECGTEFRQDPIPGKDSLSQPEKRMEHIATLDNEVQATLVDAVLSDRNIPHIMQSYHDSAYDGLFQLQKGWGVVLASPDFKDEILAVLREIKARPSSGTSPTASGPQDTGER